MPKIESSWIRSRLKSRLRSRLRNTINLGFAPCLVLLGQIAFGQAGAQIFLPKLTSSQALWLGERIFANECASKRECLTSWNEGEDFPSLGIGHFIWYRQNQDEIFTETFPDLLVHLHETGVTLPSWLQPSRPTANSAQQTMGSAMNGLDPMNDRHNQEFRAGNFSQNGKGLPAYSDVDSPWQSRADFYANIDSARMEELRMLLATTQREQAQFIIARLEGSIGAIIAQTPEPDRARVKYRAERLARCHSPAGLYALIDYVHFKGTGLAEGERYAGQGWGLQQVLNAMDDNYAPLESFAAAAKQTLARRVANAPSDRREQRWLKGWHNRIDTYLAAATLPMTENTCD